MRRGEMETDSGDLRRLIGRAPVSLADALAAAVREVRRPEPAVERA
jgi:NAD(P)H dehydrogenase (quinone)